MTNSILDKIQESQEEQWVSFPDIRGAFDLRTRYEVLGDKQHQLFMNALQDAAKKNVIERYELHLRNIDNYWIAIEIIHDYAVIELFKGKEMHDFRIFSHRQPARQIWAILKPYITESVQTKPGRFKC